MIANKVLQLAHSVRRNLAFLYFSNNIYHLDFINSFGRNDLLNIEDIKTVFDGFRNISICVALVIGLPILQDVTPLILGSVWLKFSVISFSIGMITALYGFNLYWVYKSLKGTPHSKIFNVISFFVLFTFASIAIGGSAALKILPKLTIFA